jgi:pyrimidine-nucleoside phosphorylase
VRAYDVIYKKRQKEELSKKEIEFIVACYNNGDIADYQMAAFLMAIFFAGMSDDEIFYLTNAMINSGQRMDLSSLNMPSVDKHSTGGIGDGTSLIVAPVVASLGVCVPMMAGRGLGYTGGTLDKLESIPGFRTNIDKTEFLNILDLNGVAIIGQTSEIAPVDEKMYALRDVTATVESIPLICSSIMSKKIAEGTENLVLDVKIGSGSFMKSYANAKILSEKMVNIGKKFGVNTSVVISDMDTPLGNCAGNALEIRQAIEILKGTLKNDLYELSIFLSALMIYSVKKANSLQEAKILAEKQINNGNALEKFKRIVHLQGGDVKVIEEPQQLLPKAKHKLEIKSNQEGFVTAVNSNRIGIAEMLSGAGRTKKEDTIDYSAGIILYKKTNDYVKKGETLAEVLYNRSENIEEAVTIIKDAYIISKNKNENIKLIKEINYVQRK